MNLMIAHQNQVTSKVLEAGHSVRRWRRLKPISHQTAGLLNDAVRKALGKIKNPIRILYEPGCYRCLTCRLK